jgi:hypothetical protein
MSILTKVAVEPKFKVGDWVVNKFGDVWHIDSFDKKNYQVSNGDKYNYFPISKQNEMRLWSIQDAKDGNALIEKACVKLKKLMYDNLMFQGRWHREEVIDNFIEDFKNYMKGE